MENIDSIETSELVQRPFLLEDEKGNRTKIAYERLEDHLGSKIPRDNKMALNAMCLISARESDPMKIVDRPKLLPLILAHAGVYIDCEARCHIFESYQMSIDNIKYGFWSRTIDMPGVRCLLCEKYILSFDSKGKISHGPVNGRKTKSQKSQKNACCDLCPCEQQGPDVYFAKNGIFEVSKYKIDKPSDKEMDDLNDRMEIIADTIRNLSFDNGSAAVMAGDNTFLRYLILLLHCSNKYLSGIGIEILYNISPFLNLTKPEKRPLVQFLITFVSMGLKSSSKIISIYCAIIYGAWFKFKTGTLSKPEKNVSKNYLAVKNYVNLRDVSNLLQKCVVEKEIVTCSLLLEVIWNVATQKIGCDDLCNEEDLIATLVGIATQDVPYDNPWNNETDEMCIDETSMSDKSDSILILPPEKSLYFEFCLTVNQTLAKRNEYYFSEFGNEHEKELGMNFQQCDDHVRLWALRILRNIIRLSANGKRLLQKFENRFEFQPTTSIDMEKLIQEIVEGIDSLVTGEASVTTLHNENSFQLVN